MRKDDLDTYEDKIVDKVFAKLKKESDNLEDSQAFDPLKEALPTEQLVNTIDNIDHETLDLEKISNELETLKNLISKYIDNKIQETQAEDLVSQDVNNLSSEEKIKILSDNIEDIKNQLSNFVINRKEDNNFINSQSNVDKEQTKDDYISFLENKISELSHKNMFDTLTDLKDSVDNSVECDSVILDCEKNEGEDLKINPIKTSDLQNQNNDLMRTYIEKLMLERSKRK